jgi:hypothetical protein|uniref:Uncharacterized protein n=1 Tax=Picea sitchensis TaxID=3332 RepID=A0A6B9XXM1_PICSI|nr:hypothetical protein Q903MT_gene6742 [Picea sitchensis]
MCSHYVFIIGIFSICGFNRVLLRCIYYPETKTILREAHDGVCCGHFGTHATLTKILRLEWGTIGLPCMTMLGSLLGSVLLANTMHTSLIFHLATSFPLSHLGLFHYGVDTLLDRFI